MKAYEEKVPLIVIGGHAGSFLGEYQAGGVIVVLGLSDDGKPIVGNYPCTGMHGGRIYFRGDVSKIRFPAGVTARAAEATTSKSSAPMSAATAPTSERTPTRCLRPISRLSSLTAKIRTSRCMLPTDRSPAGKGSFSLTLSADGNGNRQIFQASVCLFQAFRRLFASKNCP